VSRIEVPDGTVVVYTDVICGWSTIALHRFHHARHEAGLDDRLEVDLRLFLLEDVNQAPLTSSIIEPEKPVVGPLEPERQARRKADLGSEAAVLWRRRGCQLSGSGTTKDTLVPLSPR